jgi:hypothetical protein
LFFRVVKRIGRIKKTALPVEMKIAPEIIQKIQIPSLLIGRVFEFIVFSFVCV